uniref:DUF4283 domain-containing protein n=1 Tax=Bursaphelenchus xylophilus TaxID=6326 RepID=A0A1I7SG33_BURXY
MNLAGREGNVGLLIEIKEFAEVEAAVKGLPWGFNELIALVARFVIKTGIFYKYISWSEIVLEPLTDFLRMGSAQIRSIMDHLAENLKKSKQKIEILFDEDHSQLPPGSIYSVLKKKI